MRLGLLAGFLMFSAAALVIVRHDSRMTFMLWQQHNATHNELQEQYGRLMIEQATWRRQQSVAAKAEAEWGMQPPPPGEIVSLFLEGGQ